MSASAGRPCPLMRRSRAGTATRFETTGIPRRLWNPVCWRPDEMEFGCEQRFELGFPTADGGEEGVEGGAEVSELRVVFVVEHLSLHEPPEALDHVKVWGVARQVNRL